MLNTVKEYIEILALCNLSKLKTHFFRLFLKCLVYVVNEIKGIGLYLKKADRNILVRL